MSRRAKRRDCEPCPDCDAAVGTCHRLGCDVERCPYCGGQLLKCLLCEGCESLEPETPWPPPLDDRLPWTGEWHGERECREFGWWAKLIPGKGWVSCAAGDEGASPDLNRLAVEGIWDRGARRFVLPS